MKEVTLTYKSINRLVLVLAMALLFSVATQCSKSDDATPTAAKGGCTFTFKGTSYTLSNSSCVGDVNVGSNLTGVGAILTLQNEFGGDEEDAISFATDASDADTFHFGVGLPNSAVVISGDTWTFNATLEDVDGNTGSISGTCTCTK